MSVSRFLPWPQICKMHGCYCQELVHDKWILKAKLDYHGAEELHTSVEVD